MDAPFYRHTAKFELGNIAATPAALQALVRNGLTPAAILVRHATGDWGDLGDEDKALNDEAVKNGEDRILSAYMLADRTKLYVITEWTRSFTTILLAGEY